MPRYFLHLDGDIQFQDPDGAEHAGLYSAMQMAVQAGRELIASAVLAGVPVNLQHKLRIVDVYGIEQAQVTFEEIVSIVQDAELTT